MQLNIVYGRSGTGKSEYIYKSIAENIRKEKIFLIVPEQCNLSAEKRLFETSKESSLIDCEVLTLSRMASRVLNEIGGQKYDHISKTGKKMIIYDLLVKEKKKLNFLGKSEKNVEIVSRLFTELKKHNITPEKMKDVEFADEYTSLKVKDIDVLYSAYQERLSNKFMDENDSLTLLAENLDNTSMFDGAYIYIDEFLGFTPQEYSVFEKLLDKAKQITVAVPADEVNSQLDKDDIFYFNKVFLNKLVELAENKNYHINFIKLENGYRFKSKELSFLEKNYTNYKEKYQEKCSDVSLFLANNPYSEIEYVAKEIHNLVKKCGYKYNEIGIIAEDVDIYSEDAKAIMSKYDIPLFVDEKKGLNQNILIKFIISMLDIYTLNWSFDAVFNYVKNGLLRIEEQNIYELENYARKWGIKRNKWLKEFSYEPINDKQSKLEEIRKQIVEPLINFKTTVSSNKTVTEITKEIYKFIVDNEILVSLEEKLSSYEKPEITDEYNTSYKMLMNILDEMCIIFKDEPVTFEKYRDLLEVGLDAEELGIIPATQDQVVLGDTERTRSNKLRALFVVGINDGSFPKVNREEGYLNDADRLALKEKGIELAKNSIDSLYEEEFNIYRTLSTPEEKLFLSYVSQDKDGKAIRPSILIKKIKKLFPYLEQTSDIINNIHVKTNRKATFEEALNAYKEYIDGKEITEEWKDIIVYFYQTEKERFIKAIDGINYSNIPEEITDENIRKMYGNTLRTSVSKLESYRTCPFSFHLTYGLRLREKDELQLESVSTGSFQHEVIDMFFKEIDSRGINIRDISDDEVKSIINDIVNTLLNTSKYYVLSYSAKYRLLTNRLKKVVYQAILYILYTIRNSDFEVLGHEVEFSNHSEYKPIVLELDGRRVEIEGKIDRVDKATLGEDQYVRIIDYKSSIKDIDLNKVSSGLQIQLITYLDAMCDQSNFEPSAVLYLGLIDNIVKNAKNMTEEQIESKIRANFRMKGLVVADINVVRMMDKTLDTGASDIIPVYISAEGNIAEKRSKVVSKDDFKKLQKQVKKIIKDISTEILKGKIDIHPYNYKNKTGCDYCKYKTICMFNTGIKGNEYNYIKEKEESIEEDGEE